MGRVRRLWRVLRAARGTTRRALSRVVLRRPFALGLAVHMAGVRRLSRMRRAAVTRAAAAAAATARSTMRGVVQHQ